MVLLGSLAFLTALALQPAPASPAPLSAQEREGQARLQALAWLAGSWRSSPRAHVTNEELWSAPLSGSMVGLAREAFGQRTRSYEYMRIAVDRDGRLGFYASPGGAPPIRFGVVRADAQLLVAENAGNDYPQRIVYRREGGRLVATISQLDGSRSQSWTFSREPASFTRRGRPPARRARSARAR